MSSFVLSSRQGNVALLKLNRPKELNALNSALIQSLNEELDKAALDDEVGCVVLTGEGGKAFAGGIPSFFFVLAFFLLGLMSYCVL